MHPDTKMKTYFDRNRNSEPDKIFAEIADADDNGHMAALQASLDERAGRLPKRPSRPQSKSFYRSSSRHSTPRQTGPSDYLAWSVVNIFINVLFAIPALFFSVQTRDAKKAGNINKAKVYSKRSLILNIIASSSGLIAITTAILLRFAVYQLFVHHDIKSQNVPLNSG